MFNTLKPLRKKATHAWQKIPNIDLLWKWRRWMRWKSVAQLDSLITGFEAAFIKNKGFVHWAEDVNEAIHLIISNARKETPATIYKGWGFELSEIELEDYLLGQGLPYHNIHPAEKNLSTEELKETRHHRFPQVKFEEGNPKLINYEENNNISAKNIASNSTLIISGSVLISNTGTVIVPDEEGYLQPYISRSKNIIIVAGIEKLIMNMSDWHREKTMWSVANYGHSTLSKQIMISGGGLLSDQQTQQKVSIILLDNGRTNLLADTTFRELMYDYEAVNSNLDMALRNTLINTGKSKNYENAYTTEMHLGQKYMIDLWHSNEIIARCRQEQTVKKSISFIQKRALNYWELWAVDRDKMNSKLMGMKKVYFSFLFSDAWKINRVTPSFSQKTFNQLWIESESKKK